MIYKPSNCHPFASAEDITKCFLHFEKNEKGVWEIVQPSGVYLVGKVETSNTRAIGYRINLYENGNLVFQGGKVSPISELPHFDDDKTVNTGINGTYLAIPLFQPGNWYDTNSSQSLDLSITKSFNALYCTGEGSTNPPIRSQNTAGLITDYIIVDSIKIQETDISLDDCDKASQWAIEYDGSSMTGYIYSRFSAPQGLRLNGGNLVEENDVIFVKGIEQGQQHPGYLCVLSSRKDTLGRVYLRIIQNVSISNKSPLYVRKGAYCGFYDRRDGDAISSIDWSVVFRALFSSEAFPSGGNNITDIENDSFSWEIVLYQGPENYSSFVKTDQETNLPYLDTDMIVNYDYDMKIASGTILGSCAKRIHMSDFFAKKYIPGYELDSALALTGLYGEIFSTRDLRDRLIPSFPVASFDSSLGHVYPKDGYLSQESLERFEQNILLPRFPDTLGVRFYKYSSNMEDTLSNEKVATAYINVGERTLDPRTVLRPGSVCGGVILDVGDRVLWCNSYVPSNDQPGALNGLWVVGGTSQEEPTRPADGNEYSDYIGKAILVSGGERAGKVYIGNAVSGTVATLGEIPLYFFEQRATKLFNLDSVITSSDYLSYKDSVIKTVDYVFNADDFLGNSFFYADDTDYHSYRFPVIPKASGEITVLVHFSFIDDLGTELVWLYYLYLDNNGYIQAREDSAVGYVEMRFYDIAKPVYVKGFSIGYKQDGKCVLDNQYNHWYRLQLGYSSSRYDARFIDLSASALVLFNTKEKTYVSPSVTLGAGMKLKLKNGAFYSTDGTDQKKVLNILSVDKTFSAITHEEQQEPFEAKKINANPPTPYDYDVFSCYRVSDQNGFTFSSPLLPYIQPTAPNGNFVAGYSAYMDASCFQEAGKAWNSARLVLQHGEDPEKWQDTGWFYDGNLDTEFSGLEPGMDYPAVMYAKDGDGRITQSSRSISVPEDTAEYLRKYGFEMSFEAPSSDLFTVGLVIDTDLYGFTEDNIDQYLATLDLTSSGSGGEGHYVGSRSHIQGGQLHLELDVEASEPFSEAPIMITIWTDSPCGRLTFYGSWLMSGSENIFIESHVSSFLAAPVFTGTFPGTLTAEPDCSTQSVLLNYEPATGVEGWPNGLPPEQNGTYDIYKREYADLKKSYSCGSNSNEEQLWFGDWVPVALGVGRTNIRDFNVKQGYSYQYAIVPRVGSSLKVERVRDNVSTSIDTGRAVIAFDNSFIGLPFGYDSGEGLTATITSVPDSSIRSKTVVCNSATSETGYIELIYEYAPLEEWPVTVDITFCYRGLTYSARVVFTSGTEFTVESLNDSVSWRKRLLANGGSPVYVQWGDWSLVELDEVDPSSFFKDPTVQHPFVKKAYKVDPEKVWLFRYDVEPGSQSINLTKGEVSTLGKYARYSSGSLNAESGEVSAWLGSEVVPGYRNGYIERRRSAIWDPAATNEAVAMLAAFRAMVASDKPKLLRDRKGRSWIVQVSGGSSSTMDNIVGTPTKISFSWKEIAPAGPYVAIWGDGDELPSIDAEGEWEPNIIMTP